MARYREYSYEQSVMVPISLAAQVQPGTFEYTVNYLVDHEIDLSVFEQRYCNDETGAPAYCRRPPSGPSHSLPGVVAVPAMVS